MNDKAPDDASRPAILLVEDDDTVRRSLQLLLHWNGFRVRAFATMSAAMADPALCEVGALVTDYRLPDGNGIGLLRAMKRLGWQGRALMFTGHANAALADAAHASGFDFVFRKPLDQQQLVGVLR